MASVRILKFFQSLPDQLKKLGRYSFNVNNVIVWQGSIAAGPYAGCMGAVIDIDSSTWADGNRRAVLVAVPDNFTMPNSMKTQSHAAGQYLDGSFSFRMYLETPEAWTDAQAQFGRLLMHELVGQNGAPTELFFGTNDVQPRVEGVDGASGANESACSFASAGLYRPYALSYTGGI